MKKNLKTLINNGLTIILLQIFLVPAISTYVFAKSETDEQKTTSTAEKSLTQAETKQPDESYKCPKCDSVYPAETKFCGKDGTQLIAINDEKKTEKSEIATTCPDCTKAKEAGGEACQDHSNKTSAEEKVSALDPQANFAKAQKLIEAGDLFKGERNDFEGARRQYEEAIIYVPENPSLRYKLAGTYWKLGEHRKALEQLDICRDLYPKGKPGRVKVDAYIAKLERVLSKVEKEERRLVKKQKRANIMIDALKENKKKWSGMVKVPEGKFLMGSKTDEFNIEEMPQHEVYLSTYYIDKYEVTNGLYWEFLDYIERTDDHSKCYIGEGPSKNHTPDKWHEDSYYEHAEWPVTRLDWYDAYAFAGWAGKRLPSEAEWEKAARGTDGRRFPWGNVWDMGKCNAGTVGLLEVGSHEEGKSIYGVYDVCGSVQEWCNDWHHAMYYNNSPSRDPQGPLESTNIRVIRGSSLFANNVYQMRNTIRWYDEPHRRNRSVGFRCAKDYESKTVKTTTVK